MAAQTGPRLLAIVAAAFGLAAVLLAALGAHAVPLADATAQRLWDTALLIHFFHTAGMLAIAALAAPTAMAMGFATRAVVYSGWMMAGGTLLFSGSLYFRAGAIDVFPTFIAPAGGFVLLVAWLILAVSLIVSRS